MRQTQQQITGRPQVGGQMGGTQVRSKAAAGPIDALPSYIPNMEDPNLKGLIDGLSVFNPALQARAQEEQDREEASGRRDGAAGVPQQSDKPSYVESYKHITGLAAGQQDAALLKQKYDTEFDKDNGNLDQFIADHFKAKAGGIPEGSYRNGFDKAYLPTVMEIRKDQVEYQKKAVETRVESSAMQLIDGGTKAYLTQNQKIPDGYIESIEKYVGANLGVSKQRFQELLFESVKRQGDEGHFDAYEVLKKPRPDGSPGLYYDPAWKPKIDAAELHSFTAFTTRSAQERAQRYNKTLYDVFAEDDPKVAQDKFKALKSSGLFQGDAEGFLKWDKLLTEKVDGKPDIRQLDNEGKLLTKVYGGGLSFKEVMEANDRGLITAGQRKYLLGEIHKVTVENRTLAAQEGAAAEKIYKSKDFGSAMDYIEGVLKPRPRDPYNVMGQKDIEFDHTQLAQARREFFTASAGKKPGELQDLADGVTQRYLKRRQESDKGGMSPEQKDATTRGQVPYRTLQELREAVAKQQVSLPEARRYQQFLMNNNAR